MKPKVFEAPKLVPITRALTILPKLKELFMKNSFRLYILIMFLGIFILNGCSQAEVLTPVSTPYNAKSGAKLNSSNVSVSVSTPYNAEAILSQTIQLKPTSKKNIADKSRILLKHENSYLATNNRYEIELNESLSTYDDLLLKTFYPVKEESASGSQSCYRLDSEKHSIYSIDYDTATMRLKMRNNWGYDRDAESAYLCFNFDTASHTLTAAKRYTFNDGESTFEEDKNFSPSSVFYDSAHAYFKLNSSGSKISLYESGFDFSVPSDFNPVHSQGVPNQRVMWEKNRTESFSRHRLSGDKIQKDINSIYLPQVQVAGNNTETRAAAEKMLKQITSDLVGSGESLRYSPAVYLAFRNGLLNTKLKGSTTVNGVIEQNTVPYVFFTNEMDGSGVRHPFMVLTSYSITDMPSRLLDVPAPPGDGKGGSYPDQNVTRDAILQTYLIKIPLKNYGNVSSLTENEMVETLASDAGESHHDVYNHASISSIGVAVDGVMIYPVLNNMLISTQRKAEITNTGIHVGRGMGLHWHADGHGATGNGLNLYNLADYAGKSHPPLIGFGFDGIALFGKYETAYHDMDGVQDLLDSFGGHAHGNYGYHYHAHAAPSSVIGDSRDYTLHILMKGAWIGKINNIPEFWKGDAPNVAGQRNRYAGDR
ncbi:MAG: hypothetical protein H8E67_03580 [Proteobacteria bacterium]|jgi:hypothetical protein|nr:hypothetical protein [Pseudomonadota bacterium]